MTDMTNGPAAGSGIARDATAEGGKSTDDLIRQVMTEQKREENLKVLPELEPQVHLEQSPAADMPEPPTGSVNKVPPERRGLRLRNRLGHIRPTRRQIGLAAIVLVAIWRPWLIPLTLLTGLLLVAICYLTLGHDRWAELWAAGWQRFCARWPDRAEAVRRRADALALKWDAVLDRLPEAWADRLGLPDLSGHGQSAPEDAPDPFDRLAAQVREP